MKLDLSGFALPSNGKAFLYGDDDRLLHLFLDNSLTVATPNPVLLKNGYVWVGGNVVDVYAQGVVYRVDVVGW